MTICVFGIQIQIKKEVLAVIITVSVFLAGLAGYLLVMGNKDIIIDSRSKDEAQQTGMMTEAFTKTGNENVPEKNGSQSDEEKEKEVIKVYIVGCVNKPGIVTLEKGGLIDDAVRLAGGFTKDADLSSVNLVYKLEENLMLYIKSKKEVQQNTQSTADTGGAGKGVKLVSDSGGAVVNEQQASNPSNARVNINTAAINELDTLPGVGEATAQDIITYRKSNGPFKTIQDIMKVPRIKESRFARIKDFITVN